MTEKIYTRKELKAALRDEVSPLLIGLRNELKAFAATIQKAADEKVEIKTDEKGVGFAVLRGKEGKPGDHGKDAVVDYKKILREVAKLMPEPRRGRPGKNGDDGKSVKLDDVVERLLALPSFIEKTKGKDGITMIKKEAMAVQEILNMLEGVGIPASIIIGLDKVIQKIVSNLRPWQSGGFGAAGINQINVSFYTETPVGAVDGVNKTYTVANRVGAIISVVVNGQPIHPYVASTGLGDYLPTTTGFTMQTAIPAALANLPFTIVYV